MTTDDFRPYADLSELDLPTGQHHCRHHVPAIGGDLDVTPRTPLVAYVGWDRAQNTFFMQVGVTRHADPNEIDMKDRPYFSKGTEWGEIPTVDDLARIAWNGTEDEDFGDPWLQLSKTMGDHLERYQHLTPAASRQRSPLDGFGL
jgi:hypothetical protein